MVELTSLLPYAALGLSTLSLVRGQLTTRESANRDQRIALLEKQTELFWGMVEKHMTTVLHSPHTPDLDRLLEKYQRGDVLIEEEARELADRLLDLINNTSEQQGNRTGAVFLLAALDLRYQLDLDPCKEGE